MKSLCLNLCIYSLLFGSQSKIILHIKHPSAVHFKRPVVDCRQIRHEFLEFAPLQLLGNERGPPQRLQFRQKRAHRKPFVGFPLHFHRQRCQSLHLLQSVDALQQPIADIAAIEDVHALRALPLDDVVELGVGHIDRHIGDNGVAGIMGGQSEVQPLAGKIVGLQVLRGGKQNDHVAGLIGEVELLECGVGKVFRLHYNVRAGFGLDEDRLVFAIECALFQLLVLLGRFDAQAVMVAKEKWQKWLR